MSDGVGKTGLSVARFLKRIDTKAIYVDSRRQPPGLDDLKSLLPDAETILGIPEHNVLDNVQRIIVSPGISDRDPLLVDARAAGIDVVSDIELFVDNRAAPFVAVTGSNGKSTVTTLLALMCTASGKTALAGANLGEPALDLLTVDVPDIYLLELSSFQLQRTRHLPARVAVLLNISPDHLDWHIDEAEYRAAKYRIFREAEAAVWNRDDPHAASFLRDDQRQISFGLDAPAAGQYGLVSDGSTQYLARGTERLVDSSTLALVGVHNRANVLAAMAAGELLGLDTSAMLGVLQSFNGLPHRMQFVARHGGCDYINDSKATNVGAAIASVNSVSTPVVLIAGGRGRAVTFACSPIPCTAGYGLLS
ncbi:MAG: UDP-N-acetylmuramoyl-L-alanine--D-glutamate ligase [Woeseiaceae bacterium]|nr:UDP-N-acetylmuramoyl-L-alanine--D-glutamate ligase [Woeseiaceae bacterium]